MQRVLARNVEFEANKLAQAADMCRLLSPKSEFRTFAHTRSR